MALTWAVEKAEKMAYSTVEMKVALMVEKRAAKKVVMKDIL